MQDNKNRIHLYEKALKYISQTILIKRFNSRDLNIQLYQCVCVSGNAELKQLYTGGQFTEGVTVSPTGDVYFVDVRPTKQPGDKLGRTLVYHPKTNSTSVLLGVNGQVNGMKFNQDGKLLMASRANYGTRSLVELDLENNESRLLAARYQNKPFNGLNDLAIAPNGTIFVTDPRYLGYEDRGQDFLVCTPLTSPLISLSSPKTY